MTTDTLMERLFDAEEERFRRLVREKAERGGSVAAVNVARLFATLDAERSEARSLALSEVEAAVTGLPYGFVEGHFRNEVLAAITALREGTGQ